MIEAQALIDPGPVRLLQTRPSSSPAAGPAAWPSENGDLASIQERIFLLCLGFIGNAADARDLTQETLVRVLVHQRPANPEFPMAWIMRIARNLCIDHLRRRKVRGPQQPIADNAAIEWRTPDAVAKSEEEIRIVRRAIAQLSPRLRPVLVMREYGELSYEEIGRALGIDRSAVTSRLNRARRAVLRYYQKCTAAPAHDRRDHDHD